MSDKREVMNYVMSGIANGVVVVTEQSNLDHVMNSILIALGIVSALLSIGYTVFKWYRQVTSPSSVGGTKITIEEIEDGINKVKEEIDRGNKDRQ